MASNKPIIAYDFTGQPTVPQSVMTLHGHTMRPNDLITYRHNLRGAIEVEPDVPIRTNFSTSEEFMNIRQGDVVFTHVTDDAINTEPLVFSTFDGYSKAAPQGQLRLMGIAQADQRTEDSLSDNLISVAVFGGHHTINTGRMRINAGDRLLALPPDVSPDRPALRYGHRLPNTEIYQRYVAELFPVHKFVELIRNQAGLRRCLTAALAVPRGQPLSDVTDDLYDDGADTAQVVDEWLRIELARRCIIAMNSYRDYGHAFSALLAAISRTTRGANVVDANGVLDLINLIEPRIYGAIRGHFNVREFYEEYVVANDGGPPAQYNPAQDERPHIRARAIDQLDNARRALIDSCTLGYALGTAEPGQQLDVMVCKSV